MEKIEYINAGAGSGKTYRLTHILADLLASTDENRHVNPSEVIVATFTRAAAAEIKERARQVLLENSNLQDASRLDTAAIGTVHAVCQSFIDKYWYAIGATPGRTVIGEEDKTLYRNQSLASMLSAKDYGKQRMAIDRYYNEFLPKKKINNRDKPNPEFWADYLERVIGKMTYYEISDLKLSREESEKTIDSIWSVTEVPDMKLYQEICGRFIEDASKYIADKTSEYESMTDTAKKAFDTLKQNVLKCKRFRQELTYASLLTLYGFFDKDQSWMSQRESDRGHLATWLKSEYYGTLVKDCVNAIFNLAEAWLTEYERFKKSHGIIDYDDMEQDFLRLLEQDEIAEEIGRNYKLVMVDEFQDCNPVQLKIFDKLSHIVAKYSPLAQSSVWVGDPKQAIYGFRGSDTELINRIASRFPQKLRTPNNEGLLRDTLDTSYRSRPSLVKLVNDLFCKEGFFPEMAQLKAVRKEGANTPPSYIHLYFEDTKNEDFRVNLTKQIKDMVEGKNYVIDPKDDAEPRPIGYGDIAILCRTRAHVRETAQVLRAENIPVSAPETDIFDRAEVQLVLSVLRLSEHPRSAHEWASVLHLYNDWSTEEILKSRLEYQEGRKDNDKDDWSNCINETAPIKTLLKHLRNLTFSEKITTIILELGLKDRVRKWGEENVRQSNLMTLQLAATKYCSRCESLDILASALSFTKYLQEVELKGGIDTAPDTVKVCTYHGSKGLEWPVVMLASLHNDELSDSKLVEREFWGVHEVREDEASTELLPRYYVHFLPVPGTSDAFFNSMEHILQSDMMSQAKKRVRGELSRLMYVGMTRARDYLFFLTHKKSDWSWLTSIELKIEDAGIKKVTIDPVIPVPPKAPKKSTAKKPKPATIEEYERKLAAYKEELEKYEDAVKRREEEAAKLKVRRYSLRDLPELSDPKKDDRYVLPSRLIQRGGETVVLSDPIPVGKAITLQTQDTPLEEEEREEGFRASAFGTCVHHIFAACPSQGGDPSETERHDYKQTADQIIKNHGLDHVISDSLPLVENLYDLYSWLEKEYGKASGGILHEVPFNFPLENGHVMKGEIDLVWKTDRGVVIVDFKNHQGEIDEVLDPKSKSYAGKHYSAQLSAYRTIVENSGQKVLSTILYYNLQGRVIVVE